jgi:anti-sigma factor (TIGR02949 family)
MSNQPNPFVVVPGKKPSCMEMLQVILDGEATSEQKEYFKTHMDLCMPCFKSYELDIAIRDLLKSKCNGCAPDDLVEKIRSQVAQKMS